MDKSTFFTGRPGSSEEKIRRTKKILIPFAWGLLIWSVLIVLLSVFWNLILGIVGGGILLVASLYIIVGNYLTKKN